MAETTWILSGKTLCFKVELRKQAFCRKNCQNHKPVKTTSLCFENFDKT